MVIVVIVNLYNLHSSKVPPREIWVQEGPAVPLTFSQDNDTLVATARLSQLLPAVFANDSPIKGMVKIYYGTANH